MIGGFALVAFPARYGVSGIMTFIVNHDGIVYQKDLGPKTSQIAEAMKTYNPDRTWRKAEPETTRRRRRSGASFFWRSLRACSPAAPCKRSSYRSGERVVSDAVILRGTATSG